MSLLSRFILILCTFFRADISPFSLDVLKKEKNNEEREKENKRTYKLQKLNNRYYRIIHLLPDKSLYLIIQGVSDNRRTLSLFLSL